MLHSEKTIVIRKYLMLYASGISIALAAFAIFIIAMGQDPITAYITMFHASLGGSERLAGTLVKTIPLWLCGISVAIGLYANFWNLGAEGQLYLGAIAFTGIGLFLSGIPAPLHLLIGFIVAFALGSLWAFIPGVLKGYLGINEVVVTILSNYIIYLLVEYLVSGPWKDPVGFEPISYPINPALKLPAVIPGTWLHVGIFIPIAFTIITYIVIHKTTLGYEIRSVGVNPRAAKRAGIKIARVIMLTSLLSGGIAGLAGATEIGGVFHRLVRGISPGYGFFGLIVALLVKSYPLAIPFSAFFLAIIFVGVDALQRTMGMPVGAVYAIQAIMVISILIPEYLPKGRWKLWRGKFLP
ncbi:MAG: ABC transporter permease [Candidatus Bathyarchaeia archaeon]